MQDNNGLGRGGLKPVGFPFCCVSWFRLNRDKRRRKSPLGGGIHPGPRGRVNLGPYCSPSITSHVGAGSEGRRGAMACSCPPTPMGVSL